MKILFFMMIVCRGLFADSAESIKKCFGSGDTVNSDILKNNPECKTLLPKLIEQCDKFNNATYCNYAGTVYEHLQNDDNKAIEFYKKACDMNDYVACEALGSLYIEGKCVEKDLQMALNLFNLSCDKDSRCGALGQAYQQGIGANKDYKKPLHCLQKPVIKRITMLV